MSAVNRKIERFWRRRLIAISVILLASTTTACGGSPTSAGSADASIVSEPNDGSVQSPESLNPSDFATDADSNASLHESGTLTQSGDGTALSEKWSVGEPETAVSGTAPADVPDEVLDACNSNYTTSIAMTAFIKATVTISYDQGVVPTTVVIVPGEIVSGSGFLGVASFDINDEWQCINSDGSGLTVTYQPGQKDTYDVWILASVISNSSPTVSDAEKNEWAFTSAGGIGASQLPYQSTVKTSGSGSVCGEDGALYLYATSRDQVEC